MIDNLYVNALIDQKKKAITDADRKELVIRLKKHYTYKQISSMTGLPVTTLFHYQKKRNFKGKQHYLDIDYLIDHFSNHVPIGEEIDKVRKLIKVLKESIGE